jgi:hypothetical protein
MTTDIVTRLRDMTRSKHHDLMVPEEAAYEIERLREQVLLLEATGAEAAEEIERLLEIEKLWEAGKAAWNPVFEVIANDRSRLREALDGVMNSHGEQLHDAFAVANAILKETGQ